jgi:glycosyltransferase involved in cell wall biosynthesis
MRILFVHQNFPGQYPHLARHFGNESLHESIAITAKSNRKTDILRTIRYDDSKITAVKGLGFANSFAQHVARGHAVADCANQLKKEGFVPDIIIGHTGWGETLFLKDVWPKSPVLAYAEFFYGGFGSDTNFDPEFRIDELSARMSCRARNASFLVSIASADAGISPTMWQRSRFPADLQQKIHVIHDGVDTGRVKPNPAAQLTLKKAGVALNAGDEIVTFVARNLEPYRGYHIFMRSLPRILAERPNARVLIVGGSGVSYGRSPPGKRSWRDIFLDEVKSKIDLRRVHFVGKVPYDIHLQVLQVSSAHVYLTYPFVLSWSMIEAMSAGCLVIGSDTAPVREVIRHEQNGLLFDFFDHEALARQVIDALRGRANYASLRHAARETALQRYDLMQRCLPRQVDLIEQLAG